VQINNGIAPILSVSQLPGYQQINVQMPAERDAFHLPVTVWVTQSTEGGRAASLTADYPAFGGFFTGADGYAVAQHASDHSPVTKTNPAHAGEVIGAYTAGLLETWPPAPSASRYRIRRLSRAIGQGSRARRRSASSG